MKAMILAAGLGTRLKPFTNTSPKALFKIDDVPLIEIVLKRLISAGVTEVVVNLFHFPEQIRDFLKSKNYYNIHIDFSHEEQLLDTGGGLLKAANFFNDGQPFFLHNVDVLSDIDLTSLFEQHKRKKSLATLAVNQRETKRYFIFDETNLLCGWKSLIEQKKIMTRTPKGQTIDLAFCGIHVISPALFSKTNQTGPFSMIDCYLELARSGEPIHAYRVDNYAWRDVGNFADFQNFN